MAARRSGAAEDHVMDQVRGRASQVGGILKSGARLAKEGAASRVSKATRALKDEAARLVDDQKDWAAGEIGSVGSAIHEAARKLEDGRIDSVAGYVDAAARRLDDVAHYLEDHDVAEIIEPVADVVRKHPMAFMGGFLAAGLLLGRFIKAGQPPPVPTQDTRRRPRGGGGSRRSRRRRGG